MKPLTLPEVADHLGLSRQRVWQLVQGGQLRAERVGPVWTVDAREVDRFFALERPPGRPAKD